jgi:TonB family protein
MSRLGTAIAAIALVTGLAQVVAGQASPSPGVAAQGKKAVQAKPIIIADTSDDKLPADSFVKAEEVPQMLEQEQPVYPEKEKVAGVTGKYWLKLLINKQGLVRQAFAFKSEGGAPALEEAAVNAAKKWKFTPALANGKPVACWVALTIVFKLNDKEDKQPPK